MEYRCGSTRCEDDSLENEKGIGVAGDLRSSSRRGTSHTRGTAMSFGFRRRPASGIPMPITSYATGTVTEKSLLHPRSKSAGPEQNRRRAMDDDNSNAIHNSSSGRSTPRLAPPKKDSSGIGVRTNRFGYRQSQTRFTNKVGDICSNHNISHYNQEKLQQHHHQQQQQYYQQQQEENYFVKQQQPNRVAHVQQHLCSTTAPTKPRSSPSNNAAYGGGNNTMMQYADPNRRVSGIPEPISRYTLHTSHLPLPQYAVRVSDSNSKVAKTAANQSRKISTSKGSSSSKEGSVTEDSGVSSQPAGPEDDRIRSMDYVDEASLRRRGVGRPRNLRMVVNGKSFDVRDVRDDDSTVTEISVIPLPKSFATAAVNLNTGFVRERATQYQRIVNKDNRYTDSTASMSTTSSEGYEEGCLSEEKVYKDRSRTEKIPSIKSDFSPPSSDDPEYGHGEAMADEYSLSSSDECQRSNSIIVQHVQAITAATKSGTASKNALRSVLLTIEDPAFAAAAATTTTLIDDETSPVDSLFDSPTASITQSDGKPSKRDEEHALERSDNTLEDDSPGTPTNASNSLSLSEGREFFDDEIADQPGLIFDDSNSRARIETQSAMGNQVITENSHTLIETSSKMGGVHVKGVVNSPHHGQRLHRTGSVDTLSPCESIASDDLMLDYDGSDASSYEEQQRLNSNTALHDLDDATIISELEAQGEEVMRQWSSLLSTAHMQEEANSNSANNNFVNNVAGNNNNQAAIESGIGSDRMSRLLRSRSGTESPRSLDNMRNRQVSSPMRTSGSVSSSCVDSGDESSLRIDRGTYQYMFQDIVSIKTMLLKLKRVLQESGENDLTRAETLNPFDNPKNGLFCNLNESGTTDVSTSPGSGGSSIADELTDLRRQVVFLQGQVEDRDRTIQTRDRTIELLELQMSKLQGPKNGDAQSCILSTRNHDVSSVDTCNAATQTEKTRPVSAGPSLLQSLPQDGVMGPLVSWSDSSDRQRLSMLSELNSAGSHRKPTERLPHTLRLRQEQTPTRRVNAHARRHSSEALVSGSLTKPKDCAKSPCDLNDAEQRDVKTRVCSYIWDVMDDLSAIPQENIIDYLLERFERGQIYTWVGTLLLAINPDGETSTEDIYDLSRANDLYNNVCDVALKDVAPHIFAVAARAHCRVVQGLGKPSQVIVLNGETGTGKTFNAWRALEFLTAGNASADKRRGQDAACRDLGQRIADACRLISAFTVASTEGNEISSRHVELVWLEYKLGSVCGAMVSSYLLERNRVTMGRCNFQIFGQMMTALTDIEFADTGLSRDARYFMSSDLDPSRGQQLRDGFRDTMRAMDMLGFTEDRKKDIFQVLALLIHMSNIRFTQEDDHCRIDTDDQQSKEALENTCKLARLQKEDIVELVTSTLINPQSSWRRHPVCRRNLNTEDACRHRLHSIIRHLYDLLFHWLINSVNGILSARLFNERLGILDIFGFERFDANGIEQLCVNYVNERLQRYFMEKYLEFRRKNLQEEGLIEDAEPPDIVRLYEDRLSTIEKRLFATLNDVCLSTVPSDSATLIRQVCANGCPETRRFLKVRQENFVIQHYAGAVEYSVNDLLSKNIDKIPDEITVTFAVSKNTFLYRLINKSKLHHENGKAKKATMLSKLRCNVDSLTRELNNCDAHYVRCIKPRRLNNREWDRNELRRQLANTGILDALPLARCKYPIHFTYKEFFKRYRCEQTSDFRAACKMLESRLTMNDDDSLIHYGKHFIFLTEHTFLQLESARKQLHVECVEKIESFWIKYRNYRRQNIKGNMADAQTINTQNELIEKSPPERKRIISMGICVYAETYRRQSIRENTARDGQAVVNIDIQDESTKANLLENKYDVQLIDYSNIQGKLQFTPPNVLYDKTSYIIRWLEDVSKAMNIQNIRSLEPKKPLISHNQLADIRPQDARCTCNSSSNRFHTESGLEKNSEDYNKGEDVHVIRHGTSTLFYKNGVLSRRRPARLSVRVHTRLTCLTNSHYLVHTELPQGLQDCL